MWPRPNIHITIFAGYVLIYTPRWSEESIMNISQEIHDLNWSFPGHLDMMVQAPTESTWPSVGHFTFEESNKISLKYFSKHIFQESRKPTVAACSNVAWNVWIGIQSVIGLTSMKPPEYARWWFTTKQGQQCHRRQRFCSTTGLRLQTRSLGRHKKNSHVFIKHKIYGRCLKFTLYFPSTKKIWDGQKNHN